MITMELEGKINLSFVPFACGGGSLCFSVTGRHCWGPAAVSFECCGGEDDRERGNRVVIKQGKRRMSNKHKIS